MKDLVLLKIGGSVCTEKSKGRFIVRVPAVRRIAKEVAAAREAGGFGLIVVNGAGPFGHVNVKDYDINDGLKTERDFEGYVKTICDCTYLNWKISDILRQEGVPAFPFPSSSVIVQEKKRIASFGLDVVKRAWDSSQSLVPVMNGTMVPDVRIGGSVVSGDAVLEHLARRLRPRTMVFATDVDGIFTADPNVDCRAKLIESVDESSFHDVRKSLSGSSNVDVTGGMLGKVERLLGIGTRCLIVNGNVPGRVRKALAGEEVTGTVIGK